MLKDLLVENRGAILNRWFNLVMETYPADSTGFLKGEKDRFLNPVGYTVSQEGEAIFNELLQGMDSDVLSSHLDDMIKIRAVQGFAPSLAIGFVFLLKNAIREELQGDLRDVGIAEQLEFESRIDRLALLAFDMYMECREKIYGIRANELRNRTSKLLERMNLKYGSLELKEELDDPSSRWRDTKRGYETI